MSLTKTNVWFGFCFFVFVPFCKSSLHFADRGPFYMERMHTALPCPNDPMGFLDVFGSQTYELHQLIGLASDLEGGLPGPCHSCFPGAASGAVSFWCKILAHRSCWLWNSSISQEAKISWHFVFLRLPPLSSLLIEGMATSLLYLFSCHKNKIWMVRVRRPLHWLHPGFGTPTLVDWRKRWPVQGKNVGRIVRSFSAPAKAMGVLKRS